jgi:hypothetical protein
MDFEWSGPLENIETSPVFWAAINDTQVKRKIRITQKKPWYKILWRFIKTGQWKMKEVISFDSVIAPFEMIPEGDSYKFAMTLKPIDGVIRSEE